MNKILLVCSNLHSGSEHLVKSLCSGSRVQKISRDYTNTKVLFDNILIKEYGKKPTHYIDHIIYNYQFSNKNLLNHCFFIFLIGDPRVCISNMVEAGLSERQSCDYYLLRIRRLYEMIKKSKNKIVLFPEDLLNQNLYKFIHQKLGIKDRIKPKFKNTTKKDINLDRKIIIEAEDFYEKYRYIIKKDYEYEFQKMDGKFYLPING